MNGICCVRVSTCTLQAGQTLERVNVSLEGLHEFALQFHYAKHMISNG
jgi:hypothetical protein